MHVCEPARAPSRRSPVADREQRRRRSGCALTEPPARALRPNPFASAAGCGHLRASLIGKRAIRSARLQRPRRRPSVARTASRSPAAPRGAGSRPARCNEVAAHSRAAAAVDHPGSTGRTPARDRASGSAAARPPCGAPISAGQLVNGLRPAGEAFRPRRARRRTVASAYGRATVESSGHGLQPRA